MGNTRTYRLKQILEIFGSTAERDGILRAEKDGSLPKASRQAGSIPTRVWDAEQLPKFGEKYGFLPKMHRPFVLTVFTSKGGVLKTTIALNIARMAALHNIRTLVIGLDLQCDITSAFLAAAVSCGALLTPIRLGADEGMWTFDNPPTKQLESKYKFTPTAAWLDHVRLSSVRMNDGGSASFVSPKGLLLTNHHVARGQLQKNSTPEHDYIRDGFYAATPGQEMKSPAAEVNVLVSLENVTDRVAAAIAAAKTPEAQFAARRAIVAQIQRESLQSWLA